jgi:hypothetical protein
LLYLIMKNLISLIACGIICIVLLLFRVLNSDIQHGKPPLKVTEWDAFGYYMYLPAICIYHDCTHLDWVAEADKKYAVSGGDGIQAQKCENGNYVFKYLGGVAILEAPFFFIGHLTAKTAGYPADGFSRPYQYALGFGVLLYCVLAILLLRKILLLYFNDLTVSVTLLMVCLGTNFIQYAAIDNGQSHGYIFPLYVLILYATIKWHERPKVSWAVLTGIIIGLATISRPTEAIMLLIPMLWNTHTKEAAGKKWELVRTRKSHVAWALASGLTGVLPQLFYWKIVTGHFIYDVGSKWEFLNPHFRVLFGWEKGWFIYTPITIFFVIGMFFIKRFPFRKSVTWFCLLNIYIIIAWDDWRYGGSYSTRALVQSYPLFALPFAAFTEYANHKKWRWAFYFLCIYLLFVNLFQITQYCRTILHYDDMNRKYYGRIYLNPNPSATDMSLLDNDEVLNDEDNYHTRTLLQSNSSTFVNFLSNSSMIIAQTTIEKSNEPAAGKKWLKIESEIKAPDCLWKSYLNAEVKCGDSVKTGKVRLFSPISKNEATNKYSFYVSMPEYAGNCELKLYINSPFNFKGIVQKITVTEFEK